MSPFGKDRSLFGPTVKLLLYILYTPCTLLSRTAQQAPVLTPLYTFFSRQCADISLHLASEGHWKLSHEDVPVMSFLYTLVLEAAPPPAKDVFTGTSFGCKRRHHQLYILVI